jgi:hypothetical protein
LMQAGVSAAQELRSLLNEHILDPFFQETKNLAPRTLARNVMWLFRTGSLIQPDLYSFFNHVFQNDPVQFRQCYDLFNPTQVYEIRSTMLAYQIVFSRFIYTSVQTGDVDKVLKLIELPGCVDGYFLLPRAAQYGQRTILKMLIEAGAKVDQQDLRRYSALYYAVFNNHHYSVRLLLKHGASINDDIWKCAIDKGHRIIIKKLLPVVKDQQTYFDMLDRAVKMQKTAAVELLVNSNIRSQYSGLPIYALLPDAAKNGNLAIFNLLMSTVSFDSKPVFPELTKALDSAFKFAVDNDCLEMVKAINQEQKYESDRSRFSRLYPYMQKAALNGRTRVLEYLIDQAACWPGQINGLVSLALPRHVETVKMMLEKFVSTPRDGSLFIRANLHGILLFSESNPKLLQLILNIPYDHYVSDERFSELHNTLIKSVRKGYLDSAVLILKDAGMRLDEVTAIAEKTNNAQMLQFLREHSPMPSSISAGLFNPGRGNDCAKPSSASRLQY